MWTFCALGFVTFRPVAGRQVVAVHFCVCCVLWLLIKLAADRPEQGFGVVSIHVSQAAMSPHYSSSADVFAIWCPGTAGAQTFNVEKQFSFSGLVIFNLRSLAVGRF